MTDRALGIVARGVAGVGLLVMVLACDSAEPRPRGPSVLLVTIDTLRADHVGAYGAPDVETPTLDALAARGVHFETAIAAAPLTLPSHATILTGLYPPSHGARHNGIHRLDASVVTLAERFQAGGWSTGAVIGASVLGSQFGMAQGFDDYDEAFDPTADRASTIGFPERGAEEVSDRAIAWLEGAGDGPFFLWVHYYDPHATYRPPEPYRTRFAGRPYDGEIAYVDRELGRLIGFLEARGALHETVVAVTSDHGEGLGEHAETTHAYFLYDTVLKVPLILAGPGVARNVRRREVASLASLAPTLQALAGLPSDDRLDGVDLAAASAADDQAPPRFAYAEGMASQLDHGWSPLYSIRTGTHAYIRAPRAELYEVVSDPAQLDNQVNDSESAQWADEANARIDAIHADARSASEASLDAATRAQIESLGYVVPVAPAPQTGADPKDVHHLAELQYSVSARYFAGRYAEAKALGERGLVELPDSPALLDMLARVSTAMGEPQEALPFAERAARAVPEWVGYRVQVADLQLATGRLEAALASYRRAIEMDPLDPDARTGSVWRCLAGETDAAREDARMALEHGGEEPARFETIGNAWERCGDYAEALAVYQAGAERHPRDPRLQMRLAIQWARGAEDAKSEAALARAGDTARDPELRSLLAVALAVRGERERADRLLRAVLSEHPDHELAQKFLTHLQRSRAGGPAPPAASATD